MHKPILSLCIGFVNLLYCACMHVLPICAGAKCLCSCHIARHHQQGAEAGLNQLQKGSGLHRPLHSVKGHTYQRCVRMKVEVISSKTCVRVYIYVHHAW